MLTDGSRAAIYGCDCDPMFTEPCVPTAAELQSTAAAAAARKHNDDDDPLFTEPCVQSQHSRSNKPAASLDGRGMADRCDDGGHCICFCSGAGVLSSRGSMCAECC
jgi:hypothetical protein